LIISYKQKLLSVQCACLEILEEFKESSVFFDSSRMQNFEVLVN
jgi:hypothetical protein